MKYSQEELSKIKEDIINSLSSKLDNILGSLEPAYQYDNNAEVILDSFYMSCNLHFVPARVIPGMNNDFNFSISKNK